MRDKLRTLPGLRPGEESMVSMLLTQSVFLGIFIGAFDISAHSLLLSTFDEKIMARGYVVSGIVGILLTSLYPLFQLKVKSKCFVNINLTVATAITFILWTALILSPAKWIIFIVFIMFGPLNIITLLCFWSTTEQLFTKGQRRRLFPLADSAFIIGIIVISYSIPLLMSLKFRSYEIILISAISISVATLIQIVIGTKFVAVSPGLVQVPENPLKRESNLIVFSKNPYIRIIGIFAVLSVLIVFFIQYCFMAVTRQQYPVAEDMASFLGLFTGSMMIFILFVKRVVFSSLLRNYGMQTCLFISPFLIAGITAVAACIALFMGYDPATTGGFVLFFMFLAIGRFISKSLKDSVETSSLNIVYQSPDINIRPGFQTLMTFKFNEIVVIFSGLILTGLGLLSFIKLVHFSLLLFVISIMWILAAFRLFKEYRKSLIKETEKDAEPESTKSVRKDIFKNRFSADLAFRADYFRLISGDFSVLDKINNKWYFEKIVDHANSNKDINLLPVLKRVEVNTNLDEGVRYHAAEVADLLQQQTTSLKAANEKTDEAIKVLSGTRKPQTTEILKLLRDNSVELKRLAVFMIGKFRISDLLPEVCDCLNVPGLTNDAFEVLKTFGPDAEDQLVSFYLETSGNIRISQIILQLLGNTRSKETLGFLFSRLWSNSRQLKELAVKCLINCEFKPSEEEKQRLDQLTSDLIGLITWNLSAKITLEREPDNFLLQKINLEINRWNEFLFNILTVAYNRDIVNKIKDNLESEIIERINYGLEMIGITVSESIKLKLIALLDVVPDYKKLKNLLQFYPGEIPARKKLLEDIINRDYNLVSLWTKACALRSISKIEGEDIAETVTALLFSPEEIIQEESANLLARSNPGLYVSPSERIPGSIKKRLDKIINGIIDKRELLFEKVQLLSKYFGGIQEDDLLLLARGLKFAGDFDAKSQIFSEGCILWISNAINESYEVLVVYTGNAENQEWKNFNEKNVTYYLPLSIVKEFHFLFPDKSSDILKFIDNNEE